MIEKEPSDAPNSVRVVFRVPDSGADRVAVVGEFNSWSREAHAMELVDGHFELALDLPTGRTYRFRYLLDDERWENDWAADGYEPNEYGGDDSVVDLVAAASADAATADASTEPAVAERRVRSSRFTRSLLSRRDATARTGGGTIA